MEKFKGPTKTMMKNGREKGNKQHLRTKTLSRNAGKHKKGEYKDLYLLMCNAVSCRVVPSD